jgi:hypothetical protein
MVDGCGTEFVGEKITNIHPAKNSCPTEVVHAPPTGDDMQLCDCCTGSENSLGEVSFSWLDQERDMDVQ